MALTPQRACTRDILESLDWPLLGERLETTDRQQQLPRPDGWFCQEAWGGARACAWEPARAGSRSGASSRQLTRVAMRVGTATGSAFGVASEPAWPAQQTEQAPSWARPFGSPCGMPPSPPWQIGAAFK